MAEIRIIFAHGMLWIRSVVAIAIDLWFRFWFRLRLTVIHSIHLHIALIRILPFHRLHKNDLEYNPQAGT